MQRTSSALLAMALAACSSSSPDPQPTPAHASAPAATNPSTATMPADSKPAASSGLHSLTVSSLDGKPVELASYRGKVLLIVNVASECGYTPQYAGLQKLHDELAPRGFLVLGFPSNEFGGQEPGSASDIQAFCTSKYGVTFPLFAKIATKNGEQQSPVYRELATATGKQPNWNFCKYLVGKDGAVLSFHPSKVAPDDAQLRAAIDRALQ